MTFEARRAIEALRAGVPNGDAVRYLGAGQPDIVERFANDLGDSTRPALLPPSGFIIEGEFGTGKSHVLHCLKQEALKRNYAVSLVVISKETPLSDLDAVYKAAIKELTLPDRASGDLDEVALKLDPRSNRYAAFFKEVMRPDGELDPLFAATLRLFEDLSSNDELADTIKAFWAGGRISVSDLKRELKKLKNWGIAIKPRKNAELAPQRFVFASKLMRAAGYRGWVILLDEVELIASFGLRSRARSYANLNWFVGSDTGRGADLYAIAAATSEFKGTVVNTKHDSVNIPIKLADKDPQLAALASNGVNLIIDTPDVWELLKSLDDNDLDHVHRDVRNLYREAFGWESRDPVRPPYVGPGRSTRMHVREWITRWDLERLDPTYTADIESEALRPDLTERQGMEGFSEDESEDAEVEQRAVV